MKTCRKCGAEFEIKTCPSCQKVRNADWNAKNKEKRKALWDAWYAKNREQQITRAVKWNKENPDKARAAVRRWHKENPEKKKATQKIWNEKNKDRLRSVQSAWIKANPQSRKRSLRKWYEKNKESVKAANGKWKKENIDKRRIQDQNRKARKRNQLTRLSRGLVKRLLELQNGKCACCGVPLGGKFHLDHIMPLALGGKHEDKNMQLLTSKCNLSKHAKHPIDFMQERGFLL